tara:strand:+ start:2074 stop:2691 length:618 start_codon:yes stop_codon:yes gene_type:complete
MIDSQARQEVSKKLGPLVTPERVILFFSILALYSDQSIFSNISFLNSEFTEVLTNALESTKTTKTWIVFTVLITIFIISPTITNQTIKKLSTISLQHSEPLYKKIEKEANLLAKENNTKNDLRVIAAENSLILRKNSQFIARSVSYIFSCGISMTIFMTGYKLIIPLAIFSIALVICYQASVELIKSNYEDIQKFRLAADYKEDQ